MAIRVLLTNMKVCGKERILCNLRFFMAFLALPMLVTVMPILLMLKLIYLQTLLLRIVIIVLIITISRMEMTEFNALEGPSRI